MFCCVISPFQNRLQTNQKKCSERKIFGVMKGGEGRFYQQDMMNAKGRKR